MRRPVIALFLLLALGPPCAAMVGGATVVRGSGAGHHVVMVIGSRSNVCTATVLMRDLVLTAGHCVALPATYRLLLEPPPELKSLPIARIVVHPRYSPKDYAGGRVTADIALIKLAQPLPSQFAPAMLAANRIVKPGDRFTIVGYGVTQAGSDEGLGTPRTAALVATGKPGNLQIRLIDPATRNGRPGLGACTGDSGGPAFIDDAGTFAVAGVVSWSTGAADTDGCGGLTGVTPIWLHRAWIIETAAKLGSSLAP